MYIVETPSKKRSGKIYHTVLLRESYRENGKVKSRVVANLSKCRPEEIHAIKVALSNKGSVALLSANSSPSMGLSIGAPYVLYELSKKIGVVEALGEDFNGQLAIWQVLARVLEQGSRLSATRISNIYDFASIIDLKRGFDENDLYTNLKWLCENQERIEQHLFEKLQNKPTLFLYDVTSSYLEGEYNEFGRYGYNRDGKKRKKQIVVGLLCDQEGTPVSVEVFEGNTQDVKTFNQQISKVVDRFKCLNVTFVGDRGMIKKDQIKEVNNHNCNYITALTLPQLEKLIRDKVLFIENFEPSLKEIFIDNIRLIYRRNPERAKELMNARMERFEKVQEKVNAQNEHLRKPLTKPLCAKKTIQKYLKRLCIHEWVSVKLSQGQLELVINQDTLKEKAKYDGCYVLKTNEISNEISVRTIFERYKDLSLVESAFRTCKTTMLEIRPIYVRSSESTRGHVFVVMLAYLLIRELSKAWEHLNLSAEEGLTKLSGICTNNIEVPNGSPIRYIPRPDELATKLLSALNLEIPTSIAENKARVVSRKSIRKKVS